MQNYSALQELTKKLDEIKESWQIYTIFETEKKRFNEEFDALKKDKASLMESFNDISAKNALLLAHNKELEQKNKALENEISSKEQRLELLKSKSEESSSTESDILESKNLDSKTLTTQHQILQEFLKSTKELFQNASLVRPKALQKLEVSYQKHQRLLANPAKDYVPLEVADVLFDLLMKIESKLKETDLKSSKLSLEIQNSQNNLTQSTQTTLENAEELEEEQISKANLEGEQLEEIENYIATPKNP